MWYTTEANYPVEFLTTGQIFFNKLILDANRELVGCYSTLSKIFILARDIEVLSEIGEVTPIEEAYLYSPHIPKVRITQGSTKRNLGARYVYDLDGKFQFVTSAGFDKLCTKEDVVSDIPRMLDFYDVGFYIDIVR